MQDDFGETKVLRKPVALVGFLCFSRPIAFALFIGGAKLRSQRLFFPKID
jgi:hypothetical protein